MSKRTKRKNNKLSKRKYSRRRLSRHRVNKKKLSRRRVTKKEKLSRCRIYQKKYRQSGGSGDDWETQLRSQLVQRNKVSSEVAGQYSQTGVGPIKVFIYSDGGGNPKHFYGEKEQIELRSLYEKYNTDNDNKTTIIQPAGRGKYNVIFDKNEEYSPKLYMPIGNGEWCTAQEIGTQIQVKDKTKRRKVFVGVKNGLYPDDLCVVDEYSIIKNKLSGSNSETNLVFAATSKDSEPTHVYFISDELKSKHVPGDGGKLLILSNPPKSSEEYKSRNKEERNVDGSTPSVPSLSGWRVKHWKPTSNNDKCPYDGGITERMFTDYDTPNGIILLFSPRWEGGDNGTQISTTISFDGTPKIEPIKIILKEREQNTNNIEKFKRLFEKLSNMEGIMKEIKRAPPTTEFREIQRFTQPSGVDIVVSQGSVTGFGAGKGWIPQNIAIVNAANNGGIGGGGVDGAITRAGGRNLDTDRRNLPVLEVRQGREIRIMTGGAVSTGPNDYDKLHAAYVIHAVGPDYRRVGSIKEGNILLQQAYENSMRVAKDKGIKYIGFSLLSSGIFRGDPEKISLDEVLKIGIDTVKNNLYDGLLEVHFVAFTETEKEALLRQIGTTSESGPGLGPNLEPEPEPEPGNEIISKIKGDYSLDKPIYTNKGETINIELFSQETGFILSKQLENSGEEGVISIQVASNALLPGGIYQVATRDGRLDLNQINRIPKSHTTQEESVIDSLLHAAFIEGNKSKKQLSQVFENMIGKNAALAPPSGNQRIKHRIYPDTALLIQSSGGKEKPATNGRPWGCLDPNGDGNMSIQGVDFTEAIPEGDDNLMKYASKYNFAYTLDDVSMALSANYYLHGGVDKTSDSIFKTDVVFCYGPNVYAESARRGGTMTRSKINGYVENDHHRKYFRECVKMSYRATLISMKDNGVKYPILCYVSGGIYSGEREGKETNIFIRKQIPIIIDEINEELKKPFKNIFLCG